MKPPKRIELTPEQIEALLGRMRVALSDGDYRIIKAIVDTYLFLNRLIEQKTTSIMRLLRMIFGPKSEKTKDVLKDADNPEPESESEDPCDSPDKNEDAPKEEGSENKEKKKRKGHGKNGATAYTGADRIEVPCPRLKSGDPCPACPKGKVYPLSVPKTVVRVEGKAPVQATVYQLERLRCNLCGKVFSAPLPGEADPQKPEETASPESEQAGSSPVAEYPGTSEDEQAGSPEKKAATPKYDETAGSRGLPECA